MSQEGNAAATAKLATGERPDCLPNHLHELRSGRRRSLEGEVEVADGWRLRWPHGVGKHSEAHDTTRGGGDGGTVGGEGGEGKDESTGGVGAALDFATLMGRMKTIPRSGWVYHRISARVESIADHTFRVALMAMAAAHTHNQRPHLARHPAP
jgi:hypothetical protein